MAFTRTPHTNYPLIPQGISEQIGADGLKTAANLALIFLTAKHFQVFFRHFLIQISNFRGRFNRSCSNTFLNFSPQHIES